MTMFTGKVSKSIIKSTDLLVTPFEEGRGESHD